MRKVTVVEAQDHFSWLIAQVESGEEILVTRHGRVVAKITGLASEEAGRATGRVFDRIRENAKSLQLGGFDSKQFREERDHGRRSG